MTDAVDKVVGVTGLVPSLLRGWVQVVLASIRTPAGADSRALCWVGARIYNAALCRPQAQRDHPRQRDPAAGANAPQATGTTRQLRGGRSSSATRGHTSRASIFPTKCPGNSTRQWNDRVLVVATVFELIPCRTHALLKIDRRCLVPNRSFLMKLVCLHFACSKILLLLRSTLPLMGLLWAVTLEKSAGAQGPPLVQQRGPRPRR
jgi:hypothetical protein